MLVLCTVVLLAGVALAVQAGHDHGGVAKALGLRTVGNSDHGRAGRRPGRMSYASPPLGLNARIGRCGRPVNGMGCAVYTRADEFGWTMIVGWCCARNPSLRRIGR